MAFADSAISAGGGTAYELIFSRVPTILITTADNQENVCRSLGDLNVAIDAGWFHDLDSQRLAKQIHALIMDNELRRTLIENCRDLQMVKARIVWCRACFWPTPELQKS